MSIACWSLFILGQFLSLEGGKRIVFDLLCVSVFGGMFIIPQMTALQERSPLNQLSRYLACNNIFNALFMIVAAVLIMGLHAFHFSIASIFFIIAIISLVVSLTVYFFYSDVTIRFVAWMLASFFIDLRIKGRGRIPSEGPMIIASNHVSYLDWLVILAVSPHPVRFIIDNRFYKIPTARFWFSQAKLIPIATRRENEEVLKEAFDRISKGLEEGCVLGIFPEGWITRDGHVQRIQPGLQRIVRQNPVPIVPMAIRGLWGNIFSYSEGKVLFKKPKTFRPTVTVTVGDPIPPHDYDAKELQSWFEEHAYGDNHE